MKSLLLIRHAKSSWDNPTQNDFDRPLNARGLKDAPMMAQRLLERKIKIDAFISSPAVRAKQTCSLFMQTFKVDETIMQLQSQLYLAAPDVLMQTITGIPASISSAAIFSHNDGITEFANTLTNTSVDNMPTCSVFAVKADIDNWKDFAKAKKEFWFFDYPKQQL
ncbi:SixA phosphatase family protein [Lacibacter sediminis]|uniref:Histidine phosphatase family protein n=1 Tax=Lacibacter sediminis TaxID=2760713 RepID=A0A7G5XFC8_9BACT|nr:histidine phosphatase family protein [Lacibacter sediminis]QNA44181.1 histidine phosphatase family protein [Lacibacter sediminis]